MPRIQVLPDALVDQIAAGEVIERPASVVKELVENALDAGAGRITIEVEGGGVARIAVLDDGCGMNPEDALQALGRHATSKIRAQEDLARIATLGFRGEALPSIASVSRLLLTTAADDSGLGTEVLAERGSSAKAAPARYPRGTRVVVEDLFGNVPARRKFLKSPEAELKAIVKTTTALALSKPAVAFTLRTGPRALLELPPSPSALERFAELLGDRLPGAPLSIDAGAGTLRLTGAVSRPDATFASRTYQWLFVNGRVARDGTVAHAVALAAREALRSDRNPAFVLFLDCDPAACDVNVHPQKLEVRFREPSAVHALVHRTLSRALTAGKSAESLTGNELREPLAWGGPPSSFSQTGGVRGGAADAMAEALGVYGPGPSVLVAPPAASVARAAYPATASASPIGPLRLLGQYRESFLLAEGETGLVLVDQHVAHERVRYERILERLARQEAPSQQLLLPVTFEATPEEAATLAEAEPLLAAAGFVVSELSGRAFVVSSAPTDCPAGAIVPLLRDLVEGLGEGRVPAEERRAVLAASLACRGAVTVNTPLSPEEAARLLGDLSRCRDPFTCPHGRPILLSLEHRELLRRFGRPA